MFGPKTPSASAPQAGRALFGTFDGTISLSSGRELDLEDRCRIGFLCAESMRGSITGNWVHIGWLLAACAMSAPMDRYPDLDGSGQFSVRYLIQGVALSTKSAAVSDVDSEAALPDGYRCMRSYDEDFSACESRMAAFRISITSRINSHMSVRTGTWSRSAQMSWTLVAFPEEGRLDEMLKEL